MNLLILLTTPNQADVFASELNEVSRLDDPRYGSFGPNQLTDYYSKFQEIVDGNEVSITEINSIDLDHVRVEEAELHRRGGEQEFRLPIAVVYDRAKHKLNIRLYYSNHPIDQTHKGRAAILPVNRSLILPEPVAGYQAAFANGDLDGTLAMLEQTATVREPSGGTFGNSPGQTKLEDFYRFLYSFGGGIPLEHCSAISNNQSCAIEYNIVQVGSNTYSPEAGLAVYDFNESKVTDIRIYDDFVPSS